MLSERERLEREIKSIQDQICKLPEGKLICTRNGNYVKWYQSHGNYRTYIPKRNRDLAEQLARKRYLLSQKEDMLQEKKAIEFYLRHHDTQNHAEQLLLEKEGFSELLTPYFTPESEELREWMDAPYERNEAYPEQLLYKTSTGTYVRSKSEAIIAMFLHANMIPFRYECSLQLGDTTVFPDFTIRHPLTGQYFYWEHFGMIDKQSYCKNAFSKLQLYSAYEIYPSIQLITTYETREQPLDTAIVEALIKHYFLEN